MRMMHLRSTSRLHITLSSPLSQGKLRTTRYFAKYFHYHRDKLIDCLKSLELLSGNAKENYLSVVGHYGNVVWQLEKRILGLRLIDVSHNVDNIIERVVVVVVC